MLSKVGIAAGAALGTVGVIATAGPAGSSGSHEVARKWVSEIRTVIALAPQIPAADGLSSDAPEGLEPSVAPVHATGDLPGERAVPLKDFRVGALYGNRGPHAGGVHGGLDFPAKTGEAIFSVSAGKVVRAEWQGGAGQAVTVRTDDGKLILYGHMSLILIEKGTKVQPGDRLGRVGSTGNSTGPHLHLQVDRPDEKGTMDPLKWLDVSVKDLRQFGRD